jgi:hypothetical protein
LLIGQFLMSLRVSNEIVSRKSFELKQEDQWTTVKCHGPICEGRYGHTAVLVANQWIIFGGLNSNKNKKKEEEPMVT